MKIKTGDTVVITSGKDTKKKGKIIQAFPARNKIVVDGVNKVIKHIRAQSKEKKGQKIEFFGPISAANAMLVCPHCGKPTRVGFVVNGKEKQRICKKCEKQIS